MKVWVDKARRPEMVGGIGGFAGLFDASALKAYDHPLLATSADGVGTKVAIAQAMDKHDTIGFDLVGMLVDDLVVCGAEPLFLTDYIATGRVVPERIAAIVKGIAEACVAGRLRPGRRRDRRAPGPARPRRVRRRRLDHRRRRGRRPARPRPGRGRRRGDRDGVERPALQRLLAGAARAARAPPAGRWTGTSTSSAAPSARSCSSRPGSTPRPASTWPASTAHPRDVAHHRRRPGRQPRAGAARRRSAPRSTAAPGPRAGLRPGPPGRRRSRRPTWSGPSTAASAWSRSPRPTTPTGAVALLAGHGVDAWVCGEVGEARRDGAGRRHGHAAGQPPGLVTAAGDYADSRHRAHVGGPDVREQPPGRYRWPTRNYR